MKPVLKKEDADQLMEEILLKIAQDLPVESITNLTPIEPIKSSWIGKLVATFALIILSITALQENHNSAFSTVDWVENPQALLSETKEEERSPYKETMEKEKHVNHPEIKVANLEYDQPIAEGPVVFEASETITLKPGFSVKAGVIFTASISNSQSLSLE